MTPPSRDADRARVLAKDHPFEINGRRECRASQTPRSLARKRKKRTSFSHRRSAETFRHSPRDRFNGLFRALPGEPGFLATIASAMRSIVANLISASGYRDHATSPFAHLPFVIEQVQHHRIPLPTSVTIAKRPFDVERDNANHEGDLGSRSTRTACDISTRRANQW